MRGTGLVDPALLLNIDSLILSMVTIDVVSVMSLGVGDMC